MEILKRKILVFISILVFVLFIVLMVPGIIVAAQEEADTREEEAEEPELESETLEFDISYREITDFGDKGTVFAFEAKVAFEGEEEKYFEISNELPPGWIMEVNPGSNTIDVPIIKLKPESPETLKIKFSPLVDQEPGEYLFKITLKSTVEGDELEGSAEFTGIVKPDGKLELLPSGDLLNTDVAPGVKNKYTLIVKNTGTAPVEDISFSSSGEPEGWQVDLIDTIDIVGVGEEVEVEVTITPPERTIAGGYNIRFNASSDDGNDNLEIRTIVGVPLMWRIVGIALIAVVIAGIAVIFERLGRR